MIFAIASITLVHADGQVLQAIGDAYFFVVIAPALILALPFTALLWHLHLMEAPGWFAWPKPLGFALVYGVWIAVLLAASFVRIRR